MAAFIIEEITHQRGRRRGILPDDPTAEEARKQTLDSFDLLRLLELLFLALLMSTVAGNPAGPHGQTAIILTGLQIARLFGRRILSRWSVLGVLQALEILLLALIILLPLKEGASEKPSLTAASVTALAGTLVYGILITVSTAFSLSYWVKFFSRENSAVFENFPPLADSENWAVKFSRKAVFSGFVGAVGLFLVSGVSPLPLLFSLSVLLQGTGLLLTRKSTFSGHHPVSHLLWGLSFLLIFAMVASGLTDLTGS